MSEIINELSAEIRTNSGKGPSRRLRMQEQLPAIVYAKGQETLPITICPRQTSKILRGPLRRNTVIDLSIDNGGKKSKKLVMVKERQIHPVKRELVHVDLVEIDPNVPVDITVPVTLFGKSEAVVQGGKLDHVLHKMKVSCLAKDIPEEIKVDVGTLGFGSTHCEKIELPKGLTLREKPRVVVFTIKKPRGATKDEEKTEEAKA